MVFNRGAASLAGTDDTYAFELANIWPGSPSSMPRCCWCVWVHGCIGIHYWLQLGALVPQARQILFALAVALPVTALAGFSVAGRQVAAQIAEPGALERLAGRHARAGCRHGSPDLVTLRDRLQHHVPRAARPCPARARCTRSSAAPPAPGWR